LIQSGQGRPRTCPPQSTASGRRPTSGWGPQTIPSFATSQNTGTVVSLSPETFRPHRREPLPLPAILDRSSDIARLQLCTVQGKKGAFLEFPRDPGSRRHAKSNTPGSVFNYCSADSVLLGLAPERALGRTAPVQLERELWSRARHGGRRVLERRSLRRQCVHGVGLWCDLARLWPPWRCSLLGGGVLVDGTRIGPDGWMAESVIPPRLDRGRLALWLPMVLHEHDDGHGRRVGQGRRRRRPAARRQQRLLRALGNTGQVMLVNPAEDTVVVKWAISGAPSQFEARRRQDRPFFAACARIGPLLHVVFG
jgi:hypothetical protein